MNPPPEDLKIERVFFDLGNVLFAFDWNRSVEAIQSRTNLNREQIFGTFRRSALPEFERGRMNAREFFSRLGSDLGFEGEADELQYLCSDIFTPIEPSLAVARDLAQIGPIGLISNTNEAHIGYIREHFDALDLFTDPILSYELGLMKPDPEIYRTTLKRAGLPAERALFIDDLEENIEAARRLGWHGIHFRPETNLREALREFGFEL